MIELLSANAPTPNLLILVGPVNSTKELLSAHIGEEHQTLGHL